MAKHPKTCHFPLYPSLAIASCSVASQTLGITLESDACALHEIKRLIDPNLISLSSYMMRSWHLSVDSCESIGSKFLGILCSLPLDKSSSGITAIDLDAVGYDGFISPTVGNLSELTVLNLGKNYFRGPVPNTLESPKRLTRLDVSTNLLTDLIPAQIWNTKALENHFLFREIQIPPAPATIIFFLP